MGWGHTVGLGEGPRGQEDTWVGLSSSSASRHYLALVILGGLGVLAPFPGHRLRLEKIGGVPEEGGECVSLRSLSELWPPAALFHLWSASGMAAEHSL